MLSGKELGRAIGLAIERKKATGAIKSKAEIARHFNVKPPSIHDWIKKGSISKDKLPELWNYFSDVVGPEHWGLKDAPLIVSERPSSGYSHENSIYNSLTEERREVVDFLMSSAVSAPEWVDSDARAYIAALDGKARQWLIDNKTPHQSVKQRKSNS